MPCQHATYHCWLPLAATCGGSSGHRLSLLWRLERLLANVPAVSLRLLLLLLLRLRLRLPSSDGATGLSGLLLLLLLLLLAQPPPHLFVAAPQLLDLSRLFRWIHTEPCLAILIEQHAMSIL